MIAAFLGADLAQVVATNGWRRVFGDDLRVPGTLRSLVDTTVREGTPQTGELVVDSRPCRMTVHPVRQGSSPDVTGVIVIAMAEGHPAVLLEHLQSALAVAEQASLAKDRFLATVSHELRAPLTTLMLWEKVLREHIDDTVLRARALDVIRDSASAQSRLVGDLLDISRAISGNLQIDHERLQIAKLVAHAVEDMRPRAEARQHQLELGIPTRLGRVRGDATRLRQVLDNLLTNAIKFTPPGGHITVTCARKDNTVEIVVRDTGQGIPPHQMPTIFTPFSRTEDVLTRAERGLGIGLSIAQQLVALHGGALVAESRGVGHGAAFTITLPLAGRGPSPADGVPSPEIPRLDGICVLLIDDDPQVRDALGLLLKRLGTRLLFAGSADEARSILGEQRPDVILCDIGMPHEDGFSFLRKLRASEQRKIPAVALTAYAAAADRRRSAEVGFDAHVAKPVELRSLAAMVRELAAR